MEWVLQEARTASVETYVCIGRVPIMNNNRCKYDMYDRYHPWSLATSCRVLMVIITPHFPCSAFVWLVK